MSEKLDGGYDGGAQLINGTVRRGEWATWTHSDEALLDVADWLRHYHLAVADFVPPLDHCGVRG